MEVLDLLRAEYPAPFRIARSPMHGAPIFEEPGRAVAAVVISGWITDIRGDRVPAFARMVIESARRISAQLGYDTSQQFHGQILT